MNILMFIKSKSSYYEVYGICHDQPFLTMQEHHLTLLQRETEKLRGDIDKTRSELKYVF